MFAEHRALARVFLYFSASSAFPAPSFTDECTQVRDMVGGLIFCCSVPPGVTGFNIWSLIVAVIGSFVVLYVYRNFIEKRG
jgi:hypothetical protein